jgi:hypothetical protein
MFHIIPEGEQVVIYQLGRFHRIAGPGLVSLAPKLDRMHHTLDTREQQRQISVKVNTNGVPLDLGLHYRASLDIRWCVASRDEQARLVALDDWQREQQRDDSAFHVVVQAVKAYERAHPVPAEADFLTKLAHILPGSEANVEVMAVIRTNLAAELRKLGFRVNLDAPLYLTIERLPERLVEALDRARADRVDYERRKRIWQDMLTYIGEMPPHLQAHMLAVAEQLQPPPLNIPAGDTSAQVNAKFGPGNEQEFEVEMQRRPPAAAPEGRRAAAPPPAASPTASPAPPPAPAAPVEPLLSEDDVAQLKPVPVRSKQLDRAG